MGTDREPMTFCNEHWTELRDAISAEGLDHLVSANPEVAVIRTIAEAENKVVDLDMFDPLMFAMWNLLSNGTRIINRPLLLMEGCPICGLLEEHERTCDNDPRCRTVEEIGTWIPKAADSARQKYEELVG